MAARSETTCPGFTAKAAALVVTTSAKRPPAAVIPAATMEASASATVKAASTAAMKASASAAVETAAATATAAMKTTSATAVAAAALRKDWIRRESKTGESSKCDEESETESACHLYLPWEVGVQFRTRKLCTRTSCSYLIRFYPYTMGCTDAK